MASGSLSSLIKVADENAQAALLSESQASTSSSLTSLQTTFPLYVKAAQSYSQLLSHHDLQPAQRPTIIKRWKMVLDRADKLKKAIESRGGSVGRVAAGDEGREAEVRRKGGIVNGVQLGEWLGPPRTATEKPWIDPQPPALSPAQVSLNANWRRITWPSGSIKGKEVAVEDMEIEQGPGADCSVVAALAVCVGHNCRFNSSIGANCMFPPKESPSGRHHVKLYINGAERTVDIDDRLPSARAGMQTLHAVARLGSEDLVWVGLVEKAYMKVMGGYDFPGSNPSADLYALTGWLPERILTQESNFQREKTWTRVKQGFLAGRCLITLGTGREAKDGLIPLHAYGVLDVLEENDRRMLKIVNPWQRGRRGSAVPGVGGLSSNMQATDLNDRPQIFDMPWDAVCSSFATIEANWKPLEGIQTAISHWQWRKPASASTIDHAVTISQNPRYRLSTQSAGAGSEVWILLTQHITHKDRKGDAIAIHIFEEHAVGSVLAPSRATFSGSYTNGLLVLVRYRLLREVNELLVVPARDGGAFDTGFTLQAFAQKPVTLERIMRNLQYSDEITGAITSRSAGGNPAHPTHMNNPQYRFELKSSKINGLPDKGAVRVSVEGSTTRAWNVKLVFGAGERIADIVEGDVVLDSGSYTFSMAVAETASLQSGVYSLVVSLFEPGWTGDYNLLLESSLPMEVTPIPQEGAGLYQRSVNGSWANQTCGGRPGGGRYDANPKIEMTVAQPCSLHGRLYLPVPTDTPINLTLFRRGNGGILGDQIATSGPYNDQTSGVKLPKTKLNPGIYILVPSTYHPGLKADWTLLTWSDRPVELERPQ